MNTTLLNRSFNYHEVRELLGAGLIQSGSLVHIEGKWRFDFDRDVPGISTSTRYDEMNDALDNVIPTLFNERQTISQRVA